MLTAYSKSTAIHRDHRQTVSDFCHTRHLPARLRKRWFMFIAEDWNLFLKGAKHNSYGIKLKLPPIAASVHSTSHRIHARPRGTGASHGDSTRHVCPTRAMVIWKTTSQPTILCCALCWYCEKMSSHT